MRKFMHISVTDLESPEDVHWLLGRPAIFTGRYSEHARTKFQGHPFFRLTVLSQYNDGKLFDEVYALRSSFKDLIDELDEESFPLINIEGVLVRASDGQLSFICRSIEQVIDYETYRLDDEEWRSLAPKDSKE